jgi:hypothetical protein
MRRGRPGLAFLLAIGTLTNQFDSPSFSFYRTERAPDLAARSKLGAN